MYTQKKNFNENEDDLDIQTRLGWEITEDRMNDEIFKYRIKNSQHENNFTQLQTIMSKDEYNDAIMNVKKNTRGNYRSGKLVHKC